MKPQVRALAEASARDATQGSGTYRRGLCKACIVRTGKPDRRGSFSFNTRTGWYNCFKCALVGRLPGFEDVVAELDDNREEKPVMEPPEGFYELCGRGSRGARALEPARTYLRSRGLSDERLWEEAHLGACLEGFFGGRVVVPVLNPDNVWLGFVARTWTKKAPVPYLYPRGMERATVLYNSSALYIGDAMERLGAEDLPPVYVVEGVMDALALWPHAVALLGKPSDAQVYALADSPRPIVIALDGDAWREGEQLAMRLALEGQRAGSIRLPPGKDPDEVDRGWLDAEAQKCLP